MSGGDDLEQLSTDWANAIGRSLVDVIKDFPGLEVTLVDEEVAVTPTGSDAAGRFSLDPSDPASPKLMVSYRLFLDPAGFLTVRSSYFGLFVVPEGKKKPRPIVRVEYERFNTSAPNAHVHFHGESTELGWLLARNGVGCVDEHDFHFPIGGIRFRPTIEDFLRFMERESLWTDWKTRPSTSKAVAESIDAYERKQAGATARNFQAEAAAALQREGWRVEPPPK